MKKPKIKIKIDKKALMSVEMDAAQKAVVDKDFEVLCEHCNHTILVKPGKSVCPYCGSEIELRLSFDI